MKRSPASATSGVVGVMSLTTDAMEPSPPVAVASSVAASPDPFDA
jgi:hypothetical protein